MRVLATAKPSLQYEHCYNFSKVTLEARLVNNRIHYYEINKRTAAVHLLAEDLVKALFPLDCPIKERPFLIKENRDFWVVLNRNRTKYQEQYKRIKNKQLS